MLLTKTVKMKWHPRNKKWYEEKGYSFTKINDEFEVKVEDLTDGSNIEVLVKCDCEICITPISKPTKWSIYKKYIKENGKYYCQKCAMKLYGTENYRLSRLKNSKSIEQWCIENNRQDVLDRWDYKLNNCNPSEICYSTEKKYYFKCPKGLHESELKSINHFTNGQEGSIKCKACNSFAQWCIDNLGEDFLEKYWDYEKNIVNSWELGFSSDKKIYIKCQEKHYHGSYKISCRNFILGCRCPYCTTRNGKVHPLDSLGKLLEDKGLLNLWSDKNKKSPYEYTPNSGIKVWWKCENKKHSDYYRKISDSNMCNFRCNECVQERDESFLQEKVRLYLESLNYTILHEHDCMIKCINPKTKRKLPYDNEIIELKLIIEIHGSQHYNKNSKWLDVWAKKKGITQKEYLYYQKLKDRYKRIFAKHKGYEFLEIPYWTDDVKEEWKELINNKINEIYIKNKKNELSIAI